MRSIVDRESPPELLSKGGLPEKCYVSLDIVLKGEGRGAQLLYVAFGFWSLCKGIFLDEKKPYRFSAYFSRNVTRADIMSAEHLVVSIIYTIPCFPDIQNFCSRKTTISNNSLYL